MFTKAGDVFYKQFHRNYVIQIPVSIMGSRANGSDYTIKSSLPIEKLGLTIKKLPLNLTHSQRLAKIKDLVEDELSLGTLLEHSREKYTLDPDGPWSIHEETVGTDPDTRAAEAHVVLD